MNKYIQPTTRQKIKRNQIKIKQNPKISSINNTKNEKQW